jgi:predicted acyltransferase
MTLSFAKRTEAGANRWKLFLHVIRRSAIIFALGIFLAGFPKLVPFFDFSEISSIRIPGVLQRIAVCYLIASAIYLWSSKKGQMIWTGAFLIVYWLLMTLIPVPGYGTGVLDKIGNLAQYVDNAILSGHMWSGTKIWDPEGIISTLPAISTTLFGVLTGHMLRWDKSAGEKTAWMFVTGNILTFAGIVMDWWLPINKNLWTSSYSVFMAGMALNMFAVCYWVIDVKGYKEWSKPLAIYGMNAITVFVLSGMIGRIVTMIKVTGASGTETTLKNYLFETVFLPLGTPINASLYFAIMWILMLYLIAWVMYKRKWFLKV